MFSTWGKNILYCKYIDITIDTIDLTWIYIKVYFKNMELILN